MVKSAFRVELAAGEGVLVFSEIAVDDLAECVVMVAGLLFALVVAEGDDAAEAVVGIEELLTFGAVLVIVVALGDVILLAGDDPAVGAVVGDDLLAVLAADLLQDFEAVVEEAGDVFFFLSRCLINPAVHGIVAVIGGLAFGIVETGEKIVLVVAVAAETFLVLFADPVAVGIVTVPGVAHLQQLVGRIVLVIDGPVVGGFMDPVAGCVVGLAD